VTAKKVAKMTAVVGDGANEGQDTTVASDPARGTAIETALTA
jgi:hypothetical protein